MDISVWDTYVQREDGKIMHFDILVSSEITDKMIVFGYGHQYLNEKPYSTKELSTKECKFCHIEKASDTIEYQINKFGYYIIEMQNCN